jgi:hypothetical protein
VLGVAFTFLCIQTKNKTNFIFGRSLEAGVLQRELAVGGEY